MTGPRRSSSERRWSAERGAELVEFALALPLLLVVLGGIVDFGLILQRQQVLTNAAREGARLAVLPGYSTADVQARVSAYVAAGIGNTASLVVPAPTVTTITPATGPQFSVVQVNASYTSSFLVLGPIVSVAGGTWSLGSAITLTSASTMRVETVSAPGP